MGRLELPRACAEKFTVEGEIASGGYGVLLRATQVGLGRPAALKSIRSRGPDPRSEPMPWE